MISRKWIFSIFVFTAICALAQSQTFEDWAGQDVFRGAQLGIFCENLSSGNVISKYREEDFLIPASNLKLWTTAAALDILGAEFSFTTEVGINGQTKDDSLHGNLVVKGEGDPCWDSEYFTTHSLDRLAEQIAFALRQNGISVIKGDLRLEAGEYVDYWHNRDWSWADLGNYYGISSGAFNLMDNAQRIIFKSTGDVGSPADIIATHPDLDIVWDNQVVIGPYSSGDQAYVFGNAQDKMRLIRGSVPKRGSTFEIKASMADPKAVFRSELQRRLSALGIRFLGRLIESDSDTYRSMLMVQSPQLVALIDLINHDSNNLFAEALYKYLISFRAKEFENWKLRLLNNRAYRWKDGCGLSSFNRFSAERIVHLLKTKHEDKHYLASLASPGEHGTLKNRYKNIKLRAKTGSIEGVYALSGYLWNKNDEVLAFSILINNYHKSYRELHRQIEQLLTLWVEHQK